VLIPGAKHRAPEENSEAFVAAVKSFLDALEPAGVPSSGVAR
jgi:hypothetical protein